MAYDQTRNPVKADIQILKKDCLKAILPKLPVIGFPDPEQYDIKRCYQSECSYWKICAMFDDLTDEIKELNKRGV